MSRVLIISPDNIPLEGELSAGPGIRYWEFAKSLHCGGHQVTLAVPEGYLPEQMYSEFLVTTWSIKKLAKFCDKFDCVILPHVHSELSTEYSRQVAENIPTVIDLYDPILVENLNLQPSSKEGLVNFISYLSGIIPILKRGDLFLYGNERQKYYYLGVLNALGRLNPLTYEEELLEMVSFGVPDEDPVHTKNVIKGKLVGKKDKVVLWFSGIYPWFDAVTLVKAMKEVVREVPDAKLVFMGPVHPRFHAPATEYCKTRTEAIKLGLLDKVVFFSDWQPYSERGNWYLESDVAVCTYKNTLETLLSHRTRIVDLLWGGLPVISSEGDELSQILETYRCGKSIKIGDQKQLVGALVDLLSDEKKRKEMSKNAYKLAKERFVWSKVLSPLNEFCNNPRLAKDRMISSTRDLVSFTIGTLDEHKEVALDYQVAKAESIWKKLKLTYRADGLRGLFKRTSRYLVRRLRRA